MRYLSLGEVVGLHRAILDQTGGAPGIRNIGGLESALNHPFIDGNKRVAHAAMEVFLLLNGLAIVATVDEQERLILDLADGRVTREQLATWLGLHTEPGAR
jgi:death-on-curing protein